MQSCAHTVMTSTADPPSEPASRVARWHGPHIQRRVRTPPRAGGPEGRSREPEASVEYVTELRPESRVAAGRDGHQAKIDGRQACPKKGVVGNFVETPNSMGVVEALWGVGSFCTFGTVAR
jgi:hypothetical protein